MSAAVKSRPTPRAMARELTAAECRRVVLENVTWDQYVTICDALPDQPAMRMTYDRGRLEIMVTSPTHGFYDRRIFLLIEWLCETLEQDFACMGSMTIRKKELNRGFEPDECFWIQRASLMRGNSDWSPHRDPPPDLTVESEVTRSVLNRMKLFAAYRIPEVWRFDGKDLHVHVLRPNGEFIEMPSSVAFPGIPISEMAQFVLAKDIGVFALKRQFRAWVRRQLKKRKKQ